MKQICSLLTIIIFITSCNGQNQTSRQLSEAKDSTNQQISNLANRSNNNISTTDTALKISSYVSKIFQDKTGNLWFGTHGRGVGLYDGKSFKYFTTKEGFSGNVVRDIKEDTEGNLWFATNDGVCCYDGKYFMTYRVKNGLNSNQVWSILEDRDGILWFGTDNGVCSLDRKSNNNKNFSFATFPIPAADLTDFPNAYPAPNLVYNIYQDKSGNIWFATNGSGVYRYSASATSGKNEKSLIHFTEKDGLCNNFVQSIYEDKSGKLWFCTRFGGVSQYSNMPEEHMQAQQALVTGGVSISEENSSFTNFTVKNGLSNNFVWSVLEDKSGNLWFATAGGGVNRYDGNSFAHFSKTDGISNDYVQCILEDKAGNLWFGTGEGVTRFDGKSFVSFPSMNDGC